ncbi:DUF1758 domain-containing protein [Trichonephila clavipes]|nr:DUF1758 domain-containing protein [Trichonephila clavipes]
MQDDACHIDRNVMTTISMCVRNFKLTDLWSHESLGISNPTLEESKQNSYEDALNDFQQKLTILPNGRYELQLPWKHDPVNLPNNKGLTWARHEKVIKRAESNGFLREYQKVFEDWENLGIIEIVPEEEVKAVKCHYLAHRPVIKLQSETTKYRPCFDGSACENGKPSLNQCLYKGISLLEGTPFRNHNDARNSGRTPELNFDKRKRLQCYECGSFNHLRPQCPNLKTQKVELCRIGVKSERNLLDPYTSKGKINGFRMSILRDTGATVDVICQKYADRDRMKGEHVCVGSTSLG